MPLITVADAKAELQIAPANVTFDAELAVYVDATTDLIERYIGPVENRSVTETVRGGSALVLSQVPVVSITSITDPRGLRAAVAAADVFLNPSSGVIRPKLYSEFSDPVVVVYTAGRSVSGATIPAAIQLAARIVVAHLWQTQRGSAGGGGAGAGDDFADERQLAPGYGYAMPNRALALLAKYRTPPGIG